MLNPIGGGGGGPVIRRHLGSQELTASGAWLKADALALPYLATLSASDLLAVVVDIECVGGGGGGQSDYSSGGGGFPGAVNARSFNLSNILGDVAVTVGDGGAAQATGGTTSFGSHVVAAGGFSGSSISNANLAIAYSLVSASRSIRRVPPAFFTLVSRRDSVDGPGGGGNATGTTSNYVDGGYSAPGTQNEVTGGLGKYNSTSGQDNNGQPGGNAPGVWSYGGGGGGTRNSGLSGGAGGTPGGGGGAGGIGGAGGRGAIRLHYYIWSRP